MRGSMHSSWTTLRIAGGGVVSMLLLALGCASASTKQTLDGGYTALQAGQFDQAMTAADDVLKTTPNGPGAAEARYLRGRVFEERAMVTPAETATDLQQARAEYTDALNATPLPPAVEANIHAGIANVAYHQDDYSTALAQWAQSVDKLEKESDRIAAVYRMGQSAQRLGRWDEADKYFGVVQEMAPGQPVAQAAHSRQGARGFVVQVATFSDGKGATALTAQLRKQGAAAVQSPDAGNPALQVVRVGPFATFAEARAMKGRFASQYPNAIILP